MKSNILKLRDEITDIIIPTYNNVIQLLDCVGSMLRGYYGQPIRIIIVNNGEGSFDRELSNVKDYVKILTPGRNLGWEGGLKEGLKHSKSKYVIFANDDIFIPRSEIMWVRKLMQQMELYPKLGAIGPTTNVVMGQQNIWVGPFGSLTIVPYLIGFCVMVRRQALDEVGGIDDALPGGDDIDLSIRLRSAGWELGVKKDMFIFHHGFQTGNKLFGGPDKPNGWNSPQMTERTNDAIIRKHGFMSWWETMKVTKPEEMEFVGYQEAQDHEGEICRTYIINGSTLELGCGPTKTVPDAVGVDILPADSESWDFGDRKSVADIVADVQGDIPVPESSFDNVIARHILEHCIDTIGTLKNWIKYLKPKGRLILTVPDQRMGDWLIAHPDHVHAFVPESITNIFEAIGGMKNIGFAENYNGISFTTVYEKL